MFTNFPIAYETKNVIIYIWTYKMVLKFSNYLQKRGGGKGGYMDWLLWTREGTGTKLTGMGGLR